MQRFLFLKFVLIDEQVQRLKLFKGRYTSYSERPWNFLAEMGWKRQVTAISGSQLITP